MKAPRFYRSDIALSTRGETGSRLKFGRPGIGMLYDPILAVVPVTKNQRAAAASRLCERIAVSLNALAGLDPSKLDAVLESLDEFIEYWRSSPDANQENIPVRNMIYTLAALRKKT